jgi:opacity protein-like surface antigen
MLRSFGAFLVTVCLTTFVFASNNDQPDTRQLSKENELGYGAHALTDTDMSGFSIGLGGGLSHTMVKYRATSDKPYSGYNQGEAELDIESESGKSLGILSAFLGYGKQIQRFYVGVDVYGGYDFAKVTGFDNTKTGSNHGFWAASVTHKFYYGLSPRIGYKLAPSVLAYIGVNIEMGKWEAKIVPDPGISDDVGVTYNGPGGGLIGQARVNESLRTRTATKNALTFAPRIGIDVMLTRNVFARAEYSYLFGPKITINQNTAGIYAVASDSVTQRFSITQQRFLISVGYKF